MQAEVRFSERPQDGRAGRRSSGELRSELGLGRCEQVDDLDVAPVLVRVGLAKGVDHELANRPGLVARPIRLGKPSPCQVLGGLVRRAR